MERKSSKIGEAEGAEAGKRKRKMKVKSKEANGYSIISINDINSKPKSNKTYKRKL